MLQIKFVVLVLSLLLVADVTAATTVTATTGATTTATTAPTAASITAECDTLSCWLASLVIVLPPMEHKQDGVTISLSETTCTNTTIMGLNSTKPNPLRADFVVYGLGLRCTSTWSAHDWILHDTGDVVAIVKDSSVETGVQLVQNSTTHLIDEAQSVLCNSYIYISDLTFSHGGPFDLILDLAKPFIVDYVERQIEAQICADIKQIVESNLTFLLQEMSEEIAVWIDPQPNPAPYNDTSCFVNFLDNPYVNTLDYIFDVAVGVDGPFGLDVLLNHLTNNTGAVVVSNLTQFLQQHNINASSTIVVEMQNYGTLTIEIVGLNISGLNNWCAAHIFVPVGAQTLDYKTELCSVELSASFRVAMQLGDGVEGTILTDFGILMVNISRLQIDSLIFLGIDSQMLRSLSNDQLLSPACVLETINVTQILKLALNFLVDEVDISLLSPVNNSEIATVVSNILSLFVQIFTQQPAIPAFLNAYVSHNVIPQANLAIAENLAHYENATSTCPSPESIEALFSFRPYTYYALISGAAAFAVVVVVVLFVKPGKFQHANENLPLMWSFSTFHEYSSEALVVSSKIPVFVRYGLIFVIFANAVLLMSSDSSVGASVFLEIETNNSTSVMRFPALYDISLKHSVRDMWHAKVYFLSVLIAVFSGVWPFVKLVLLLGCWIIPGNILGPIHRGRTLLFLDVLGKFSLVESFVLVLMTVSFHFSVSPPISSTTPPGTLSIQTRVEPHYSYFAFMAVVTCSLVITHVMVHYHRKTVEEDDLHYDDGRKMSVFSSVLEHLESKTKRGFIWVISPFLVIALALILTGENLPSMEFTFRGAFGYILHLLQKPTSNFFSVLTLGAHIAESSESTHSPATIFLLGQFFLFVVAAPVLYVSLLILTWLWPLSLRKQRMLYDVLEIAQAWSALEVYLTAFIAALLELHQFQEFIVGHKCDVINMYLKKYANIALNGDDQCFDVKTSIRPGCWVLFSGCILYLFLGLVVFVLAHRCIRKREMGEFVVSVNNYIM